jgi:hypothetical protein
MDEPTQADREVVDELIRVNRDIIKAIALVRSGAPDKENGELIEIAESHLDTGMKLLTRAVTPFEDRP